MIAIYRQMPIDNDDMPPLVYSRHGGIFCSGERRTDWGVVVVDVASICSFLSSRFVVLSEYPVRPFRAANLG